MKKLFWGCMYVVCAALAILTFWLYFVPEEKIYTAERKEAAPIPEEDLKLPEYEVGGVPFAVGETTVGELTSSGLTLQFEKNGKTYGIDLSSATTAKNRYEVMLCRGEEQVGKIVYLNSTDRDGEVKDAVVTGIALSAAYPGYGKLPVEVNGKDVIGMTASEIEDLLPDFRRTSSAFPEYRKSIMTDSSSIVAKFAAKGRDGEKISDISVRSYISAGGGK